MNRTRSLLLLLLGLLPITLPVAEAAKGTAASTTAARITPASAPALALQNMPIIYQGYNDCGPASIGMVLAYYKQPVDVKTISAATKASPNSYMHVEQIGRYVGRYGLQTTQVRNANIGAAVRLIRLGVPVIALTYFQQVGVIPHFRVVRGFDQTKQLLYLADPLAGSVAMRYADFNMLWNTQGKQMVAVYPPNLHQKVQAAIRGA
ncbi:C39 family peptidase [Deinococcus sp. SL84]|uniref:C39 family peptidase n=1 Tax=Deinococcus sp. SL84 TaxID=2994663 RepID=UPI002276CE62|nr:C39 family peptidase [Deinococcus sp. SL84]MCY1703959.1 C39 family peptidase [Deinococcus sp. SL84]